MSDEPNTPPAPAKPFTDEQAAALSQIVNSAITSHAKREKPLAEQLKAVDWAAMLKPLIEAHVSENGPPGAPDPALGNQNQPAKPDPKMTALEAKVQELTGALTRQAEEAKAAKEAERNARALADLKSALGAHVRPDALDLAARDLFVGQKRVTFDDQGNPLLTVRRAAYTGAPEEEVAMPLADGVSHWAKGEGKFFAPAPGTTPAATPPGQAPRRVAAATGAGSNYDKPAATDAERQRRIVERSAAMRDKYGDRFST